MEKHEPVLETHRVGTTYAASWHGFLLAHPPLAVFGHDDLGPFGAKRVKLMGYWNRPFQE
jgi:hypothetical protein